MYGKEPELRSMVFTGKQDRLVLNAGIAKYKHRLEEESRDVPSPRIAKAADPLKKKQ